MYAFTNPYSNTLLFGLSPLFCAYALFLAEDLLPMMLMMQSSSLAQFVPHRCFTNHYRSTPKAKHSEDSLVRKTNFL